MRKGATDPQLAHNLRRLVRERHTTMLDLGARAGVSHTTLYDIGRRFSPTLHTLRAVKAALGCTWDELLGP